MELFSGIYFRSFSYILNYCSWLLENMVEPPNGSIYTLFWTMFHKNMLKTVQGWHFLKQKTCFDLLKKTLVPSSNLLAFTSMQPFKFLFFFFIIFRGVCCIGLAEPSVMFCSGFTISINQLNTMTLLMFDNFPILKINKLRTSQPQKTMKI